MPYCLYIVLRLSLFQSLFREVLLYLGMHLCDKTTHGFHNKRMTSFHGTFIAGIMCNTN